MEGSTNKNQALILRKNEFTNQQASLGHLCITTCTCFWLLRLGLDVGTVGVKHQTSASAANRTRRGRPPSAKSTWYSTGIFLPRLKYELAYQRAAVTYESQRVFGDKPVKNCTYLQYLSGTICYTVESRAWKTSSAVANGPEEETRNHTHACGDIILSKHLNQIKVSGEILYVPLPYGKYPPQQNIPDVLDVTRVFAFAMTSEPAFLVSGRFP